MPTAEEEEEEGDDAKKKEEKTPEKPLSLLLFALESLSAELYYLLLEPIFFLFLFFIFYDADGDACLCSDIRCRPPVRPSVRLSVCRIVHSFALSLFRS